jgi:hypothetical protein
VQEESKFLLLFLSKNSSKSGITSFSHDKSLFGLTYFSSFNSDFLSLQIDFFFIFGGSIGGGVKDGVFLFLIISSTFSFLRL